MNTRQKTYEDAKKRCGSHRKLTGYHNQRISSGLLNKYSLEVIHQSFSQFEALRTLYNWLHNGLAKYLTRGLIISSS